MNIAPKKYPVMVPKTVYPKNIRNHGLLGLQCLRQHMIVDERWSNQSIMEEYKGMTDLLDKRHTFQQLEHSSQRDRLTKNLRSLRHQCRDGRTKLAMTLRGNNVRKIRNHLIDHKDMQRLYQTMPIQRVVSSMNQRSFVMRKEKDRLLHRSEQLKAIYYKNLVERAHLENRLKCQNEYKLEEDRKSKEFRKLLENSSVRLKAFKNINITYQKLTAILRHDSIFYEPIMRSLSDDIDEQAKFVKHILFIGMPGIATFQRLSEDYRLMDEKQRKTVQERSIFIHSFIEKKKPGRDLPRKSALKETDEPVPLAERRYTRETKSMTSLKHKLEAKTTIIKKVEFATLCSDPKEIFSRIKSQVENNIKLHRDIQSDTMVGQHIETKMKRSTILEEVLVNNLDEDEIKRLDRIRTLQEQIIEEGHKKAKILAHMKDRANAYVVLRLSLWNLADILRHVDRYTTAKEIPYPASYLELPLLKFELLPMISTPPEPYEADVSTLVVQLRRKVHRLMKAYDVLGKEKEDMSDEEYATEYNDVFLETMDLDDSSNSDLDEIQDKEEEEMMEAKLFASVPNRLQMKAASAKFAEEMKKRED